MEKSQMSILTCVLKSQYLVFMGKQTEFQILQWVYNI